MQCTLLNKIIQMVSDQSTTCRDKIVKLKLMNICISWRCNAIFDRWYYKHMAMWRLMGLDQFARTFSWNFFNPENRLLAWFVSGGCDKERVSPGAREPVLKNLNPTTVQRYCVYLLHNWKEYICMQ